MFSRPPEQDGENKAIIIGWELRLDELADSADAGCHFCSFMACRFFDDRGFTFVYGGNGTTEQIACCGSAPKTQKTELVSKSIARIREFAGKYPDNEMTLVIQPTDYSQENMKYGRIRISGFQGRLEQAAVDELLGYRSEIILELYALKGTLVFPSLNSVIEMLILRLKRGSCSGVYPNSASQHQSRIRSECRASASLDLIRLSAIAGEGRKHLPLP